MILWITGLSAAGKTTLGHEIWKQWRAIEPNTVLLDGDEIRLFFKQDNTPQDYSLVGRRASSQRMVSLCEWLDRQEMNAISCNIGMFSDIRQKNRSLYKNYFEIFLEVSLKTLRSRDPKNIYKNFDAGETKNVVGLDIPFENSQTQDMTIQNDNPKYCIETLAHDILAKIFKYDNNLESLKALNFIEKS